LTRRNFVLGQQRMVSTHRHPPATRCFVAVVPWTITSLVLVLLAATVSAKQLTAVPTLDAQLPLTAVPPIWFKDQQIVRFIDRLMRASGVPIVFETVAEAPVRPQQTTDLSGKTLRHALDLIAAVDPRYTWREISGVVVIRPHQAWSDQHNPLNQILHDVKWPNITSNDVLMRIMGILYESPAAGKPDYARESEERTFSVQMRQPTVLDVLVASGRAHGRLGWFVVFEQVPSQRPVYSVGFRAFNESGETVSGTNWNMPGPPTKQGNTRADY
jgi:hypothetical protein